MASTNTGESGVGGKITPADVDHVANLARLVLSGAEKERFREQLNQILTAAVKLQELDTDGVVPTAHAIPVQNVFREDRPRPSLPKDRVLQNAPETEEGCFKVPKILDEA